MRLILLKKKNDLGFSFFKWYVNLADQTTFYINCQTVKN